jgi:hypothetical protein
VISVNIPPLLPFLLQPSRRVAAGGAWNVFVPDATAPSLFGADNGMDPETAVGDKPSYNKDMFTICSLRL